MDFGACLDELRDNLLRDTSTLKSGPPDHYWSDETLARYIEDAHRRFARRALCIRDDTTPEVTQVVLRTNQNVYVLHESVLRVTSARHQDSTQDLLRITHPISFARHNPHTDPVNFHVRADLDVSPVTAEPPTVVPLEFATDEGVEVGDKHQVRLLVRCTPDSTQNGKKIYLRVIRLPLERLTLNDRSAIPEVPEDWHLDMLEWAAYRALRNWDGDAEDRAKAEKHKARFEEAVKECLAETADKMFQPPTWAFGQGGFSYVHN